MLIELLLEKRIRSLSVIGMVKNAGKTVTLNHLIQEASKRGIRLGLTSVGRDGEKRDAVYSIPKPSIFTPAGAVVATAQACLQNSSAQMEILMKTGFQSAMGEIIIGRVIRQGNIELAGPSFISQQLAVKQQMQKLGAELVLVDGALDRVSTAVPTFTEAVVLATGAALGGSMQDVLDKTGERIDNLTLKQIDENKLELCRKLMDCAKAVLLDRYLGVKILDTGGALVAAKALDGEIDKNTRTVLLAGAVGNDVMQVLVKALEKTRNLELVIRNGTCLFSDRHLRKRFMQKGGTIRVLEPITLLAIMVNPTSPDGMNYHAETFLKKAGAFLHPYPVFDLNLGKSYTDMEEAGCYGTS